MTSSALARLVQAELRDVWTTEDRDFTPWLAQEENLKLLSESIGMNLELDGTEVQVGSFSADILCTDAGDGTKVLIENQLERTDHTHLGQIFTYAAGLQAVTIIWISRQLQEEHKAALDWLNEISTENFRFFGLEIEVWRIGESALAPKFNIVSKPNDWSRGVARSASQIGRTELTEAKQLQLDFWAAFKAFADEHETLFDVPNTALPQSWLNQGIGRSGFHTVANASLWDSAANSFSSHELRAELYLDGINANAHFEALEAKRAEITTAMDNADLTWHNPPDTHARRIYVRQSVDLNDRTRWTDYCAWLVNELNRFHRVFRPIIRNLEP